MLKRGSTARFLNAGTAGTTNRFVASDISETTRTIKLFNFSIYSTFLYKFFTIEQAHRLEFSVGCTHE